MSFEFDEATHIYKLNGKILPSVTQIIAAAGLSNVNTEDPAVLAAGLFGKAVHKTCEYYDFGTLDIKTVDDAIIPYLDAWKKFLRENAVKIYSIERKLYHPSYRFAGTIDRVVSWNDSLAILDIKSSASFPKYLGLQTGAYQMLWNCDNRFARAKQRRAVLLKPDGNYSIDTQTKKTDANVFLSALTCYREANNNL